MATGTQLTDMIESLGLLPCGGTNDCLATLQLVDPERAFLGKAVAGAGGPRKENT